MGIPKGEERGKGTREIFDVIMAENFPKLVTDIKTQIQGLRELQAGQQQQKCAINLDISYSNCRKPNTERKS